MKSDSWRIMPSHPMALLFDLVDPLMKFQQGSIYNKQDSSSDAFAKYHLNPEEDPDITDTDESREVKPYEPIRHL
jgi:hypothetical protein